MEEFVVSEVSIPALAASSMVQGNRFVVLIVACFVGFVGTSGIIVYGVMAPSLITLLQISSVQSSMLSASPLLAAACLAVPVTLAARSIGSRVISASLCLVAGVSIFIASAVIHWASNLPSLYALFVILGLLTGFAPATVNSGIIQCSWWFPLHQQGTVAGIFLFAVSLGPAVVGSFAEPLISATSLSILLVVWGSLMFLAALLNFIFAHNPPYIQLLRSLHHKGHSVEPLPTIASSTKRSSPPTIYANPNAAISSLLSPPSHTPPPKPHLTRSVTQRQVAEVCRTQFGQQVFPAKAILGDLLRSLSRLDSWCVILMAAASLGALLGFIVWVPTFFVLGFGVSASTGGLILLGYGVAGAFGCAVIGIVADRINEWLCTFVCLVVACACFSCLAASPIFGLSVAACILGGFFVSAYNTCCYKLVVMYCPESTSGTIGWMETFGDLIAFALPLCFGAIEAANTTSGWIPLSMRLGMIIPAAILALSTIPFLILWFMKRHQKIGEDEGSARPEAEEG